MSETRDIVERAEAWLADVETEVDADIIVSGLLDEVVRLRAEIERYEDTLTAAAEIEMGLRAELERRGERIEGRVETGPVRIGDDWAGIFIRGDNAIGWMLAIRDLLDYVESAGEGAPIEARFAAVSLASVADTLASCREPCDAVRLVRAPSPEQPTRTQPRAGR